MKQLSKIITAAMAMVALTGTTLNAEEWRPDQPATIIVGVTAGGSIDTTARLIRDVLVREELIAPQSIVSNVPGGSHAVALAETAGHAGNGNFIQIIGTPLIANNVLGRSQISYADFSPVSLMFGEALVFATKADSDIADGKAMLERITNAPDSLSFAVSSGLGTSNHAAVVLTAQAVGADVSKLKLVSFSSGAEGTTAALGGHVDIVVTTARSILPFQESGDLRILAVASSERLADELSEVPTLTEMGADVVVEAWRAAIAPPELTAEQVAFWTNALQVVGESDEWKKMVADDFLVVSLLNSSDTADFFKVEHDTYAAMIENLNTPK